jgi:two-component system LytT family response regulator
MPDRPLRAVVVDDERLARRELRALLAAEPVKVVAEAADADAADAVLARLDADGTPPDVLFLDVQMPERTGFDLLDGLAEAGRPMPDVVFVTAYDEHALRAFRVSAVDYLLKPVDPAALAEAVARVAARRAEAPEAPAPTGRLGADDRVFVKDGDRMHLVRIGDVRRFESVGNYTRLHFRSAGGRRERAVVARSLTALEERLDPAVVVRASRSDLVGLGHVVGVDEAASGGLVVRLDDGQAVEFSRRRAQDLRDRLSL